jgi:hypothetical protein
MTDIHMEEDAKSPAVHPFNAAIQAMRFKKPAPEIDFTLHTMDDGTEVSTLERVCKGEFTHAWRDVYNGACFDV